MVSNKHVKFVVTCFMNLVLAQKKTATTFERRRALAFTDASTAGAIVYFLAIEADGFSGSRDRYWTFIIFFGRDLL